MGSFRERAGLLVTREMPFKLLSLAFAIALWAWVQTKQVVDRHTRVYVHYKWPEALVPVEEAPVKIGVTVKGPQGLVRTFQRRKLHYEVDLSEADPGPTIVDFTKLNLWGLPEGVEVMQISKPAIEVELDHRMEREVRIRPSIIGEVANGWRLETVDITPQRATVSGPRSLVRNMADVTTEVIDISSLTESRTFDVSLMTHHRTVTGKSKEGLKVTVNVSPIVVEKTFNDVPVMSRAEDWRAVPPTAMVILSGNTADMLDLSPERVSVQAHLPNPVPIGKPLTITFSKGQPDSGLEVVHQGPDSIEVVSIEPSSIQLEHTP